MNPQQTKPTTTANIVKDFVELLIHSLLLLSVCWNEATAMGFHSLRLLVQVGGMKCVDYSPNDSHSIVQTTLNLNRYYK